MLVRCNSVWYKRYFGPYEASLDHWPKFRAELERLGIRSSGQRHGLVFDDPDITEPEKIRYGCAIDPVPEMNLPDCWSVFEMRPSRFAVFTIRSTYLERLVWLRPRVIAWLVDHRECFGTSDAYQWFGAMPSADFTQERDMELRISLAN